MCRSLVVVFDDGPGAAVVGGAVDVVRVRAGRRVVVGAEEHVAVALGDRSLAQRRVAEGAVRLDARQDEHGRPGCAAVGRTRDRPVRARVVGDEQRAACERRDVPGLSADRVPAGHLVQFAPSSLERQSWVGAARPADPRRRRSRRPPASRNPGSRQRWPRSAFQARPIRRARARRAMRRAQPAGGYPQYWSKENNRKRMNPPRPRLARGCGRDDTQRFGTPSSNGQLAGTVAPGRNPVSDTGRGRTAASRAREFTLFGTISCGFL